MSEKVYPPRLLADGMLGRLAKWLRLMGYDTAYNNCAADPELARRARAEGRTLLTRDQELAARRGLHVVLIHSEMLEEQVREVQRAIGPPPQPALSRCALCNIPLTPVLPHQVADQVPPFVLRTHAKFHRCPACGRVYWPGSHVNGIRKQLSQFSE